MKCRNCKNHGSCELEPELGVNHKVVCHSYEQADPSVSEQSSEVEGPAHYKGRYECIDVMLELYGREWTGHFCVLCAFKYLWRCRHKHKTHEMDIEKARWYLNKYHELNEMPCKITNGDRLKAMGAEELAAHIICPYEDSTHCIYNSAGEHDCPECTRRWLESEAQE